MQYDLYQFMNFLQNISSKLLPQRLGRIISNGSPSKPLDPNKLSQTSKKFRMSYIDLSKCTVKYEYVFKSSDILVYLHLQRIITWLAVQCYYSVHYTECSVKFYNIVGLSDPMVISAMHEKRCIDLHNTQICKQKSKIQSFIVTKVRNYHRYSVLISTTRRNCWVHYFLDDWPELVSLR